MFAGKMIPLIRKLLGLGSGLIILLTPLPSAAEFSDSVLDSVRNLQEDILFQSRRNINGADTAAMWALFDQDVLFSLNGGVVPLTMEELNKKYGVTDIRVPAEIATHKKGTSDVKTGAVRIQFIQLPSSHKGKPDWMAIYYHGLGVVPASTFHIFRYDKKQYRLQAAMEKTSFLNAHPRLQWSTLQIVHTKRKQHFDSYFVPLSKGQSNRTKVNWKWDGKELEAQYWIKHYDFHKDENGAIVSKPGPIVELN